MKVNRRALVSVLAMVITFVLGMGLQVDAAQYLGQVHWAWHKTQDEQGPTDKFETYTVSLFFLGGSYYELVGGSTETETTGSQYGGGTAVLVGNNLIMTLTGAKDRGDGLQETVIFKGQVDKTTFNGTGWAIKKRFNPATRAFIDKYAAGTLSILGSPPPLRPVQLAPMLMLMGDN